MRAVLLGPLLLTPLLGEAEFKGSVGAEQQSFFERPAGKGASAQSVQARLELSYGADAFSAHANLYAQHDFREENDRSFARLDELYGRYDFEESSLSGGKMIRFWGALEVRNIVDGFNVQEMRNDPFTAEKTGAWSAAYTYFTDSGELSLIVKAGEEDQKMAGDPYVYDFSPRSVAYDDELRSGASLRNPTVYLLYSGSTEFALDYALILQHGFDAQRYFLMEPPNRFTQHVYKVNKAMTYNTLASGSTLWKLEGLYADVLDEEYVSDYCQLGVGVEHTLEQLHEGMDLGLIAEYYRYETFEEGKFGDLELFETFQNDLFLGIRLSANDAADTSMVAGAVLDWQYGERNYYAELETRLFDAYRLEVDYRYVNPSDEELTAFALLGRHERLALRVAYHF